MPTILESFGTGDGSTVVFQLSYSRGSRLVEVHDMPTDPPIYVAGVLTVPTSVSTTGLVTFASAPAGAAALTWDRTVASLLGDVLRLDPGAIWEGYKIDAGVCTGDLTDIFYLHAGTNVLNTSVTWQAIEYQAFPIHAEGWKLTTQGSLPRPTLTVSNVHGVLGALIRTYEDFVGAKVTRKRTLAKYLDAVNFEGGVNAYANPDAEFADEVYYIERKVSEDRELIVFELACPMDIEGEMLPKRQIIANVCSFRYRVWTGSAWDYTDATCPYVAETYFDVDGASAGSEALDVPSFQVATCCTPRFPNQALPFGGFPGCGNIR